MPKLICGPVGHASSNSTSGKPGGKTLSVVVATNGLWVAMVLGHWKSTNLSPPVNQGGFQQSPLLEVFDQCGTWLVGSLANGGQILLDMVVVVPWLAAQEELNKSNAPLNQTTCDQTSFAVFFGFGLIDSVKSKCRLGFLADIERLFGGHLHVGCHFVTGDPRLEIHLTRMLLQMALVEEVQ